jgi:hypothetical protein
VGGFIVKWNFEADYLRASAIARLHRIVLLYGRAIPAIKHDREVLRIGQWEVGRRGVMPRWGTRRGVNRIAAREEVARMLGIPGAWSLADWPVRRSGRRTL